MAAIDSSELRYAEFCELGHFANLPKMNPVREMLLAEEDCNACVGFIFAGLELACTDEQLHDAVATAKRLLQ